MKHDGTIDILERATASIIRAKKLIDSRFGIGPGKIQLSEKEIGKQMSELPDKELIALLSKMKGEF